MGNKGKKWKKQFYQKCIFESILRKDKKSRTNAVAYWDKILIDLLYLFYKEVQKTNLTWEVWLIENNTSAYQKATKLYVNMIKEKGIKKVD